ncbi:hypothetical protein C8F01DRAFT_1157020 [Mycena amicta]|nr:hypothetical protein C8F01DRAFT_1157020 [Mycena amicta]
MSLPPELWLHIHALATAKTSALAVAQSDRFTPRYQDLSNPFKHIDQFHRDVYSFLRVSRMWNMLATGLLYQNIVVDDQFPVLHRTLKERPELARSVRAVCLSIRRFDYNSVILLCCPDVQVIVQPDDYTTAGMDSTISVGFDPQHCAIPKALASLKHMYWVETDLSTGMLQPLLVAAPQLVRLFVSESSRTATRRTPLNLSTVKLQLDRLSLGELVGWDMTRSVLGLSLSSLTSLECAPGFIEHADFPATLPQLHTLRLSCFRSRIPFARIFVRFPALRDLWYGVWDSFVPLPRQPHENVKGPNRLLVRLTSAISFRVVRDWKPIHDHFALLLDPAFPPTARVVLYGAWDWIMSDSRFVPIRTALRVRGCVLEHPEGRVVN